MDEEEVVRVREGWMKRKWREREGWTRRKW